MEAPQKGTTSTCLPVYLLPGRAPCFPLSLLTRALRIHQTVIYFYRAPCLLCSLSLHRANLLVLAWLAPLCSPYVTRAIRVPGLWTCFSAAPCLSHLSPPLLLRRPTTIPDEQKATWLPICVCTSQHNKVLRHVRVSIVYIYIYVITCAIPGYRNNIIYIIYHVNSCPNVNTWDHVYARENVR